MTRAMAALALDQETGPTPMPASTPAVDCRNVSIRFTTERGTVTALDGVNVRVPRGGFLSLLGPSGCGKSTLLRLIADLVQPSSGTVAVLGEPPAVARSRREIGFVFQDAALLPWRSVLDNVRLPLDLGGKTGSEGEALARGALARVEPQ